MPFSNGQGILLCSCEAIICNIRDCTLITSSDMYLTHYSYRFQEKNLLSDVLELNFQLSSKGRNQGQNKYLRRKLSICFVFFNEKSGNHGEMYVGDRNQIYATAI